MISRVPITVSAPILVGLPVLIVGIWLSGMWNWQSRHAVTELADQNIDQIHDMAATKVADVLSIPERICRLNEHLVQSDALDPADLSSWRPTLAREAQTFDMLSAISWGSEDGRSVWVSRYSDGSFYWAIKDDPSQMRMTEWRLDEQGAIIGEEANEFEFDLFSRPWFLTPREAGEATWSDPFVWVGGVDSDGVTLGISFGVPLQDSSGSNLGVVDADFSLNDLSGFLREMRIGRTGFAVLTTATGEMLAASIDTPIVSNDGELIRTEESPDERIKSAASLPGQLESNSGTHARMDVDGSVHYVRSSPIGQEIGLDWTLLTIIPESDFTARIDSEFQRSWMMSLVAVGLAVLAGLSASRWLVAPLTQLVSAVRSIGKGDLDTRVELRHAPEYTHLANEINAMTLGLQDRMRMRQSLSLAMEVQKNLLPSEAPTIRGLDIAGHSTYCDETGGDYYDYLDVSGVDDDAAVIAVGDVMGHGVAAAMLMATARGILRSRSSESGSLADFLDHVNAMLVPDTRGQRFMTMLLVMVSAQKDSLRWASAGHGPPIIFDSQSGSFLEMDGGGLPLGLMEEESYEEYTQSGIRSGSLILGATDGLWETMNTDGTAYGMDRVRDVIRAHASATAAEIRNVLLKELTEFRGPAGQDDDLTFVIAKVR